MCDGLSDLKRAIGRCAARFRADALSPRTAKRTFSELGQMESEIQAMKAMAAARAAEADTWKDEGFRSAAEALAADTGISVGAAREMIDTGRRLLEQPRVAEAARRGELSFPQTSLIANAVEADPKAERRLVERARRVPLSKLKDECAATKAQAHPDLEARRKAIHGRRCLRSWTDVEGVWHLKAAGNPEDGAQVMTALEPIRNSLFERARNEERRESPDAYSFDALVELAKESIGTAARRGTGRVQRGTGRSSDSDTSSEGGGSRSGAPVKLLVRVDLDTFLRGFPVKGEKCEIAGFGPVAMSAVRALLETGDPFVAAILTKGQRVVGVAHLGRKPTTYQRSALEWLYPTCAVDGCNARARLEMDHTVDWSKTRFTMLDYLRFLCHHHHHLKTHEKWAPIEEDGRYLLVSPDDPRHPRHRNTQTASPASARAATRARTVAKQIHRSSVSIAIARRHSRLPSEPPGDIHLRRMTT